MDDVEQMEKTSVMTTLVPTLRPDQYIPLGTSSLPSVDQDLLRAYAMTEGEQMVWEKKREIGRRN